MKKIRTLVLLADDAHVRMMEQIGKNADLIEIEDMTAGALAGANAPYSDRAGRNTAAPGMALHAFARVQTVEELGRAAFARDVLAETATLFAERDFDRFVLVAAPDMLGEMRAGLPPALKDALAGDLAKDYLKLKPTEVALRLVELNLL